MIPSCSLTVVCSVSEFQNIPCLHISSSAKEVVFLSPFVCLFMISCCHNYPCGTVHTSFFIYLIFFHHSFILHRLENRTRPISTPYDGQHRWYSNLRTPSWESPALPLCYGHWPLQFPYQNSDSISIFCDQNSLYAIMTVCIQKRTLWYKKG